jgi:hypothetical protein
MIGDLDISPSAISVGQTFDGCTNRTQVAAFMSAMAWEKFVKGVTVGAIAGIALTVGVALYLKKG